MRIDELHFCLPGWARLIVLQAQEQGEPKSATHLPESSEDGLLSHSAPNNIIRIFANSSCKMMFRLTTKIAHVIFHCAACNV